MKINAVIRAKTFKISNKEIKNTAVYLVGFCVASGIVAGCIMYLFFEENIRGELWEFFLNFTTEFYGKTKIEILSGLLLANMPYLIFMYFSGTNLNGYALSLIFTFIKSFGLGLLVSYIFCAYALKGIEFCLLILFPGKIVFIFAMVLLTENCFNTSYSIYRTVKEKNSSEIDTVRYNLRTALISVLVIISSFIDFIMIICFSSLFNFS